MNSGGDKYLLRLLVFMMHLNLGEFNEAFMLEKNATWYIIIANYKCFLEEMNKKD